MQLFNKNRRWFHSSNFVNSKIKIKNKKSAEKIHISATNIDLHLLNNRDHANVLLQFDSGRDRYFSNTFWVRISKKENRKITFRNSGRIRFFKYLLSASVRVRFVYFLSAWSGQSILYWKKSKSRLIFGSKEAFSE